MKAMQDKIIAIITNMVLALALIVVASTISSDVTGISEGETGELDNNEGRVADVDASLIASDDLVVGEPGVSNQGASKEAEGVVDVATINDSDEVVEYCEVTKFGSGEMVPLVQAVKLEYEDAFLVNVSNVLNVRADASEDAEIVGKIYAGQGGTVIWQGDGWSHVRSGNVIGYIKDEYAWFGQDVKDQIEESGQQFAVVTASKLRVRLQASTSSSTLGMVVNGEKLQVVEYGKEWTKVIFENAAAYVSSDYITLERSIGTGVTLEEEQIAAEAEEARKQAIAEEEERKRQEAEEQRRKEQEAMERAIANSGVAEIVKTSGVSISAEDAYLIACCVSAEVGSSSYDCQLAVANVILNRYKAGYANSIKGVIYAKNQFSVTKNGSMDKYIKNGPRSTSVQAVKAALEGNNNMVGYYHFCYLPSANFNKYSSYIILGSEVFYRSK